MRSPLALATAFALGATANALRPCSLEDYFPLDALKGEYTTECAHYAYSGFEALVLTRLTEDRVTEHLVAEISTCKQPKCLSVLRRMAAVAPDCDASVHYSIKNLHASVLRMCETFAQRPIAKTELIEMFAAFADPTLVPQDAKSTDLTTTASPVTTTPTKQAPTTAPVTTKTPTTKSPTSETVVPSPTTSTASRNETTAAPTPTETEQAEATTPAPNTTSLPTPTVSMTVTPVSAPRSSASIVTIASASVAVAAVSWFL